MFTRKKHLKTGFSLFCAVAFLVLLMLPSGVVAAGTEETLQLDATMQATTIMDTTAMTQQEYQQNMLMLSKEMTMEESVQPICEWFISSIFASRRSENYDCTVFVADSVALDGTIAYITSENEYKRLIREAFDLNVVSDEITFDNFKATILGDSCSAEIGVHYQYELTGRFNETCYVNCVYYLELVYDDGWKVVSATTSMPGEQSGEFVYAAFDAQAAAQALIESEAAIHATVVQDTESAESPAGTPVGVIRTTYSVADAIEYAKLYHNSRNPLFGSYPSANCQNFASQCVWYGLLSGCNANGTSKTAIPAVSTSLVGASAPNVWCQGQVSTYYTNQTKFNYSWINVNGFLNLINVSNYTQIGPQGTYRLGLAYASAGDVIAWDEDGTRSLSNGTYDHAMFVTRVTGASGSRGMSDMFIAANTTDTSSAYAPLVDYTSNMNLTASNFATADIAGGYYLLTNAEIDALPTPSTANTVMERVDNHVPA